MYIPVWVIHVVSGLAFLGGLLWATKEERAYDFSGLFKVPFVCLLYAIYWIVWLLLRK